MSLGALHWAWSLCLPPIPMLVTVALAHEADDAGYCFPSVPYLATKCSISERTVQRILRMLARDGYLAIEQRFGEDGARISNGYRLAIGHSPSGRHQPVPSSVTRPVTLAPGEGCHSHRGGDTGDGATTTTSCQ